MDVLAVGLVQCQREVDAVHNGIGVPHPAADLPHHVEAEGLPVRKMAQRPPVEGRVGQLLKQIPLVAVKVHTVQIGRLGVGRGLPGVFDDGLELVPRKGTARDLRHVKIGVPRRGNGHLKGIDQALRIAHPAEAGGELNEEFGPVGVHARCDVAPGGKHGARPVDAGEAR